jgi:hypothetical protein
MTVKKNDTPDSTPADDDVLARFGKLRDVLTETHSLVPQLLQAQLDLNAQLARSEANGHAAPGLSAQLKQSCDSRQGALRRRRGASSAILELEGELQSGREKVQQEMAARAVAAIAEFSARYRAAVAQLEGLWEEGNKLAAVLRLSGPIHMPIPARPVVSWDGSLKMTPVLSSDTPPSSIDLEAAKIGEQLDRFDSALQLIGGIKRSVDLNAKHYALCARRGSPPEVWGVFAALQPIQSLIDGLPFAPGTVLNHELVSHGELRRLLTSNRWLRRLEEGTPAAA